MAAAPLCVIHKVRLKLSFITRCITQVCNQCFSPWTILALKLMGSFGDSHPLEISQLPTVIQLIRPFSCLNLNWVDHPYSGNRNEFVLMPLKTGLR